MYPTELDPCLLVLPLDETLVYGGEKPLERPWAYKAGPYFMYHRPYLDKFLRFAFAHFQVAVWTASSKPYADIVVAHVFAEFLQQLAFVWTRERCTQRFDPDWSSYRSIKDFKKVRRRGFDLARVLVVDDTPQKHVRNYGNLVRVRPFVGAQDDDELLWLSRYLGTLCDKPNMRALEKRGWRHRVAR